MRKLLDDTSGQMTGTAALALICVVATLIMGVTWIAITPTIDTCFGFFNVWVGEGWVTQQSESMMFILHLIWVAAPSLAFLFIIVGTYIQNNVLKGVR